MTEEQIERFMYLFRVYRANDELPKEEREEFRNLAKMFKEHEANQKQKGKQ